MPSDNLNFKGQTVMLGGKIFDIYLTFLVGCELSLIRINPKPTGIPCIITKLIKTVNHFTGIFNLPSFSQSDQL